MCAVVLNNRVKVYPDIPHDVQYQEKLIEVMKLVANVYDVETVKNDIQYLKTIRINGEKITLKYIAERVGVNPKNLYRWINEKHYPLNPLPLLHLRVWAETMREEIEKGQHKISQNMEVIKTT